MSQSVQVLTHVEVESVSTYKCRVLLPWRRIRIVGFLAYFPLCSENSLILSPERVGTSGQAMVWVSQPILSQLIVPGAKPGPQLADTGMAK